MDCPSCRPCGLKPAGRLDSVLVLTGVGTGMRGIRLDVLWLVHQRGLPSVSQAEGAGLGRALWSAHGQHGRQQ